MYMWVLISLIQKIPSFSSNGLPSLVTGERKWSIRVGVCDCRSELRNRHSVSTGTLNPYIVLYGRWLFCVMDVKEKGGNFNHS